MKDKKDILMQSVPISDVIIDPKWDGKTPLEYQPITIERISKKEYQKIYNKV